MNKDKDFSIHSTFNADLEFIEENHDTDNWFLNIDKELSNWEQLDGFDFT